MNGTTGTVVVVVGLLLAAWSLVAALRNRPVDVSHLALLGLAEIAVLVHTAFAVARLIEGARPHHLPTLLGYLVAFLGIAPLAWVLARAEPTRWGSVIVTVAGLVLPVLVVRLNQVWSGVG